jgi:Uma2 family endonuclease
MATIRTTPRPGSSDEGLPPLVPGERLDQKTFHARYEAMPEDVRAELIQGVVSMPSPLGTEHSRGHTGVMRWLTAYMDATPGTEVHIDATIILSDEDEPQPDASLLILPSHGGQTREEGGFISEAPELVVEVALSSTDYDLNAKRETYERAGVLEYVVVVLKESRVLWFARRGEGFVPLEAGRDGILHSFCFPGLWLDPDALLRSDASRVIQVLRQGLATPEHVQFVERLQGS